jgi:lysophospholipase L1-like esterase
VDLRVSGSWSLLPLTLVSVTKVDDGVFGLGGLRVEPRGADSVATVIASPAALPGKGSWDLALRFVEEDASIVAVASGKPPMRIEANPKTLGQIRHVELATQGPGGQLRVEQGQGRVQLLGAVAESEEGYGVVLDTLGLNGARVRSALAWDEATWGEELGRRRPDLVVLAFGTNESSDVKLKSEVLVSRVKALVARIHAAAPEAECLVFGPIDRGGETYGEVVERINEAQAVAARESGCAFWNGQRAMGGKGSMQRWATSSPPLGGGDRIHLYPRGYQLLGEMLARDLLRAYGAGVADDAADGGAVPGPAR